MKDKIYNSLNSIVLTDTQKEMMFQNITRPRNKLGGYILKTCAMVTCFVVSFMLFSNKSDVENNNGVMPRTINQDCETEDCLEAFNEKE